MRESAPGTLKRGATGGLGGSGFWWRAGAVTYLLMVWVASLWPAEDLGELNLRPLPDTVEHGVAYFVGALLVAGAFRQLSLLGIVGGLVAMGALVEMAQALTASRQFSVGDMAANGVGTVAGIALVAAWRAVRRRLAGGAAVGAMGRGRE